MTYQMEFMRRAIIQSEYARYIAPPNPWVGCVIVNEGQIVGQGHTQACGQDHAEICALKEAGNKSQYASLYVTLEPCAHTGLTPPCTEAIIHAGIQTVYIGIQDPDPKVSGKGMTRLREAGLDVFVGNCETEIKKLLESYITQRSTRLPFTILKVAMSVDGRAAASDLTSQWITCPEAREDVHLQRAGSQAIIIGSNTALQDMPLLTARHTKIKPLRQPLRVLLDGRGRVPATGPLFDQNLASTLIFTTSQASRRRQDEWIEAGAEVVNLTQSDRGIDLQEAWKNLGKRGILQVLVEGGATLHTSLLESKLVNRLSIYMGPLLLGSTGLPIYQKEILTLKHSPRFTLQDICQFGDSVRLNYIPFLDII